MSDFIKGITIDFDGKTTKLDKALREVNQKASKAQRSLRGVNHALKFDPRNTVLLTEKQKLYEEQLSATKAKVERLKAADKIAKEGIKNGTEGAKEAHRHLQKEIAKAEGKVKTLGQSARLAAFEASKFGRLGGNLRHYGAQITNIGKKMQGLSVGAGLATTGMVKFAMDAEDNFAKVNSILGLSGAEWQKYEEGLKQGARSIHKEYKEYAEAAYQAISASVPQAQVNEFLAKSAQLAKGGMTDMTTATDLLTTVINAYGLKVSDAAHINDVFLQTQNKGKTTVALLGNSMGKVIPIASSLGVSIEELGAQYSILTRGGIQTKIATTYIKSMLTELSKNGSKADKTLRQLTGKGFAGLIKDGKSTGDVLQILKDQAEKGGLSLKDMFSNTNSASSALALMKEGTKGYNQEMGLMASSTGLAAKAAAEMSGTKASQLKKAMNDAKNAAADFGATILPIITPLIQKATALANSFSNMSDGQKKFVANALLMTAVASPITRVIGGITTGAGKAIGGIGKLTSKFESTKKATTLFKGAFSKVLTLIKTGNPWAIGAVAVGVLTAALIKQARASHELERASKNQAIARQENVTKSMEDAAINQTLAEQELTRLDTLSQKRNKSASDVIEIQSLVKSLNGKVQGLNLSYDAQNDKLSKNTSEIRDNIAAMKEQALAEAYKQNLMSASKAYAKSLKDESDAKRDCAKAERDYKNLVKSGKGETKEGRIAFTRWISLKERVEDATKSVKNNKKEVKKWGDIFEKESGKIARIKAFNSIVKSAKLSAKEIPNELKKGIENGSITVPASVNTLKRYLTFKGIAKKAGVEGKNIPKSIVNGILSGKLSIKEAEKLLKNEVGKGAKNVGKTQGREQAKGVKSTAGLLKTAGGILKKSLKQGASGSLSSEGSHAGNTYKSGVSSKKSAAYGAGESLKSGARSGASGSLYDAGRNLASSLATGIRSLSFLTKNAAEDMAGNVVRVAKKVLKMNSPSKVFTKIGRGIPEGLAMGINQDTALVIKASKKMSDSTIQGMPYQSVLNASALGSQNRLFGSNMTTNNNKNNTFNISMTIDGAKDPSELALEFTRNLRRQVMAGG